jgi:SPP1 family predicted phage head-tail adaptor
MAGRFNIGSMDRRITLRVAAVAADAAGQPIETWSDLAVVWGSKQELSGQEPYAAGEKAAEVDAKFIIRYRSDVTPLNRLICNGREYDIINTTEMDRRLALEILARARAE